MDSLVLRATRQGDTQAFADLVETHYRSVYGIAFSTVGDWSAAEDISQETFLVAWANFSRLNKPGAFSVWLRKIARNLARNWLRSASYRRKLEVRQRELASNESTMARDVTDEVERGEERAGIWDALRSLSPKLREVVVLYYLEGKSVEEAARALDCTASAVKKRLARARPRLRAYFEARWQTEIERERRRLNPRDAATRFLGGAALGPVQASIGAAAARAGMHLWMHGIAHGELPGLVKGTLGVGGHAIAAKLAVVGCCALVVGAAAVFALRSPTLSIPGGPDVSAPKAVADAAQEVKESPPEGLHEHGEGNADSPANVHDGAGTANGDQHAPVSLDESHEPDVPTAPLKTGRITGSVVDDEGNPVPNAAVTATLTSAPAPQTVPHVPSVSAKEIGMDRHTAVCDRNGAFLLEGLPSSGAVVLTATAKDYYPGQLPVELRAGRDASDVTFVLSPCVTLEGQVLSTQGVPVSDATVQGVFLAWSYDTTSYGEHGGVGGSGMSGGAGGGGGGMSGEHGAGGGGMSGGASCSTDDQGRFALPVSRTGLLTVKVDSPTCGQATFSDIAVEPDAFATLKFASPAGVHGRILWRDGKSAEGCTVTLRADATYAFGSFDGGHGFGGGGGVGGGTVSAKTCTATVTASGDYRMEDVDPGPPYVVDIADDRGQPVAQGVPLGGLESGRDLAWDYVIEPPIILGGGVYVVSTYEPVAGIDVQCAKDADGAAGFVRPQVARTGPDGRYELRVLTGAGTYRVAPRYVRFGLSYGPAPEDEFVQRVRLETGQAKTLDLTFPAPWNRRFRVTDLEGGPLPGCSVEVREHWLRGWQSWRWPELTDSDGRVHVTGLAAGAEVECVFSQEATGAFGKSACVAGLSGETRSEETVVLQTFRGLLGALVDETETALGDTDFVVSVSCGGNEEMLYGTTDAAGDFELEANLPATAFTVVIEIAREVEGRRVQLSYTSEPKTCHPSGVADMGVVTLSPARGGE